MSVPALLVTKKNKINDSVNAYFDVISQESVEGWEFVSVAQIDVLVKGTCKNSQEKRNVFIFAKEAE